MSCSISSALPPQMPLTTPQSVTGMPDPATGALPNVPTPIAGGGGVNDAVAGAAAAPPAGDPTAALVGTLQALVGVLSQLVALLAPPGSATATTAGGPPASDPAGMNLASMDPTLAAAASGAGAAPDADVSAHGGHEGHGGGSSTSGGGSSHASGGSKGHADHKGHRSGSSGKSSGDHGGHGSIARTTPEDPVKSDAYWKAAMDFKGRSRKGLKFKFNKTHGDISQGERKAWEQRHPGLRAPDSLVFARDSNYAHGAVYRESRSPFDLGKGEKHKHGDNPPMQHIWFSKDKEVAFSDAKLGSSGQSKKRLQQRGDVP